MGEAVRGNRVGPDHPQGKRPEPPAQAVDDRVKERQEKKADAAGEEHPARRPDSLHHRADAQLTQAPAQPG